MWDTHSAVSYMVKLLKTLQLLTNFRLNPRLLGTAGGSLFQGVIVWALPVASP